MASGNEVIFSKIEDRIQSFNNSEWINTVDWTRDYRKFALAGFYSIGHLDYVKCFSCDGRLCSWTRVDDPWIEHAKHYPHCDYLRAQKCQSFITTCREMYYERPVVNVEMLFEYTYSSPHPPLVVQTPPSVEIQQSHQQNNKMLCKICYENVMEVVFLPCAHQISCIRCSQRLLKCPYCRANVTKRLKVFIC
ncbi:baculoviral IAP repeat-containing protein 3-like [Oppia nitens]|uniref:baculoviral IAP repeat-containing protein 3-like n=1 Tax=Oppia nitens TaxID=1686743 RepID=UPI0023DAE2B2|nr:baculoviral IAP repeat-containing protein 3-like [Oppia nitens]